MEQYIMEINLENYISEQEMRAIASEEFRNLIREKFIKEADVERILGNLSYHLIGKMVDEQINDDHKQIILKHIDKCLNEKDFSYHIFREKNVWDREESLGQQYVKQAVLNNKQLIFDKVNDEISKFKVTQKYLKELLIDNLIPKFLEWLKK